MKFLGPENELICAVSVNILSTELLGQGPSKILAVVAHAAFPLVICTSSLVLSLTAMAPMKARDVT